MNVRPAPITVVVVEQDSAQRTQLLQVLQRDGDVAVVGLATRAAQAVTAVAEGRPDVVIVDLHLGEDGARQTIEQLMARAPTPILVLSAQTEDRTSPCAVQALLSGALDALPRPALWTSERAGELSRTLRQISKVHVIRHPRGTRTEPYCSHTDPTGQHTAPRVGAAPIVAVGASTGGPSALATLLAGLAGLGAPVLIVQHLHPDFTGGLLEWMARVSALPVQMAEQDQTPRPGRVYLAPGGVHLRLGTNRRLELHRTPATVHRPSVDQLFESVAGQGAAAIGVLLTGMGEDGARGLLAIHRNGGQTLAQDEASCAVFGMPRAAQLMGAVTNLLPLDDLAAAIHRAALGTRV